VQGRIALVKQLKDNPQAARSVEESYGKDYARELHKADPARLEAEAEELYAELTDRYLPDMKPASVALLCQQLYDTSDSEVLRCYPEIGSGGPDVGLGMLLPLSDGGRILLRYAATAPASLWAAPRTVPLSTRSGRPQFSEKRTAGR
jgi:hypothetical protein